MKLLREFQHFRIGRALQRGGRLTIATCPCSEKQSKWLESSVLRYQKKTNWPSVAETLICLILFRMLISNNTYLFWIFLKLAIKGKNLMICSLHGLKCRNCCRFSCRVKATPLEWLRHGPLNHPCHDKGAKVEHRSKTHQGQYSPLLTWR